jgi:hypothetical protein
MANLNFEEHVDSEVYNRWRINFTTIRKGSENSTGGLNQLSSCRKKTNLEVQRKRHNIFYAKLRSHFELDKRTFNQGIQFLHDEFKEILTDPINYLKTHWIKQIADQNVEMKIKDRDVVDFGQEQWNHTKYSKVSILPHF